MRPAPASGAGRVTPGGHPVKGNRDPGAGGILAGRSRRLSDRLGDAGQAAPPRQNQSSGIGVMVMISSGLPLTRPSRWRPAAALPALAALLASAAAGIALAAPPARRSPPPSTDWDRVTAGAFYDDAFSVLPPGPRPDFTSGPVRPPPVVPPDEAAFAWSKLVSGDTLTDEIKDLKERATATVATSSTFKGGGYDEAREAFSMLALAFGLIAAHDDDIRWQRDAATARDLFARAGFNCKVGTDQTFNESRLRIEDLEAMIQGNPPRGQPEPGEDFRWSEVAGRSPLMKRLEHAADALNASVASSASFKSGADRVFHEAEIVAAIGEVICQPDFEYFDDDTYREYAGSMRDAAVRVREACLKQDYETARAAVGEISKSCDACHGDYR